MKAVRIASGPDGGRLEFHEAPIPQPAAVIDRSFRMDEIAAAHEYMQADRHFGKIVIAIDPSLPTPR